MGMTGWEIEGAWWGISPSFCMLIVALIHYTNGQKISIKAIKLRCKYLIKLIINYFMLEYTVSSLLFVFLYSHTKLIFW